MRLPELAPIIFRMLISFSLVPVVNTTIANNPIDAIETASNERKPMILIMEDNPLYAATGSDLTIYDDFNVKVYNKLNDKPDGYVLRSTILYAGYFQAIRVLPRERDIIKPFIGVRSLYHGEYGRKYESDSEQQAEPDGVVLENIRSYGLDPADFYEVRTTSHSAVSLDLVVGAMMHLKGTTLFASIDIINSRGLSSGSHSKSNKDQS
jgi:hypothetical protein